MQTITVELTHQKALKLLQELEDLHIIRLLKKSITSSKNNSEKFAGKLSPSVAADLQKHISKSRDEWEGNT